jgi:hypothetical protein
MLDLDYARRAQRHAVDLPCELVRADCDEPLGHRVTNLSGFGAWVRTSLPMRVRERLVIVLKPPDAGEMVLFGEVIRRSRADQGMAIEFVGVSREERARLLGSLGGLPSVVVARRLFARQAS